jgi:hypothetical protein
MKGFLPLLLLGLAGCDLFGTVHPTGRPVSEAYAGTSELRILDVDSPLRREKRIPVLSTPEVLAAYVPAHTEADMLIGDHWLYLKLGEPTWISERLQQPDPLTTGDAPPESMRPLREVDWSRIVLPHKN